MRQSDYIPFWMVAILQLPFHCAATSAHIVTDGSVGPARNINGPNYTIGANLGTTIGGNLFQSFSKFNISSGEEAVFTGSPTLSNIIVRVTGSVSTIDGTIETLTGGTPNFFLIDPAGVVFGAYSSLDVKGSFHVSTADYLKFAGGALFMSSLGGGSTLTTASPAAFGFLDANPAKISINGYHSNVGLSVANNSSLDIVAGGIQFKGEEINAVDGTIQMIAVESTGEVPLDATNSQALTVTKFGSISITSASSILAVEKGHLSVGDSIYIRASDLTISDSTLETLNRGASAGKAIVITGDHRLSIVNRGEVYSAAQASGAGATIALNGGDIAFDQGSSALTATSARGSGGAIAVTGKAISLRQGSAIGASTEFGASSNDVMTALRRNVTTASGIQAELPEDILSGLNNHGTDHHGRNPGRSSSSTAAGGNIESVESPGSYGNQGVAGHVRINAENIRIAGAFSEIFSNTFGISRAGGVDIAATGKIEILGAVGADQPIGIVSAGSSDATGDAGNISIKANSIQIAGNAADILTSNLGNGNAGDIDIRTTGAIDIYGSGLATEPIGISSSDYSILSAGNAGYISINSGSLEIMGRGAIVATDTFGLGDAGDIAVRTVGAVEIGGEQKSSVSGHTVGISSSSASPADGNAGHIEVSAGSIAIAGISAEISSSTYGYGNGGGVLVTATGLIKIRGVSDVPTSLPTGILASSGAAGISGAAGSVKVSAADLVMLRGAVVSSASNGSGPAGSVSVGLTKSYTASGFGTGLLSTATGSGDAGDVTLRAKDVTLSRSAEASSDAGKMGDVTDTGFAGLVNVHASDKLVVTGSDSAISADALGPQSGVAGTVTVSAASIMVADTATISTEAAGVGAAGGITVTAPVLTIDNGSINSNTLGSGAGGAITLDVSGNLTMQDAATIFAQSSGSGKAGSITVQGLVGNQPPAVNLAGGSMISAASSGAGDAGSVIVTAGNFSANGAGGGLLSTARGSGNAGDVTLSANDVTLSGGAKASSDAGILGEATETGFAGLVSVHASDKLVVTGPDSAISADALGPQSGVAGTVTVSAASIMVADSGAISTKAAGVGAAGGITVSAPVLTIDNGSINSNTSGSGAGGSITLDVDARLTMLDTATALPPSEILAQSSESGKAGSITVQGLVGNLPPAVSLAGGSKISAASTGAGDAGSVIVTAGNFSANGSGSGLLSTATVAGNAGQVTLEADTVTLSNGAVVSSNVLKGYPTGPKGNVMVTAIGSIKLDSGASISAGASGAEAAGDITIQTATLIVDQGNISTSASGSGAGGAILVQGFGLGALPLVSLSDGSQISAASSGQSNAGSIVLSANSLAMTTGASISTSAATANGGNISISTQYLTYLQQSKISTTVDGAKGNGGNIGIESGRYVILDSANVEADAAGGNGGNITIATKQFIASPDSIVQASSATGISGDITIRAPADTVTAALANLSTRLGAPNVRLDCSAAAERTGTSSVIPRGQHVSSEGGSEMESMRYFAGRPIIAALPGSPSAGTGAPPAIGIPVPAANEADWPAQTACH